MYDRVFTVSSENYGDDTGFEVRGRDAAQCRKGCPGPAERVIITAVRRKSVTFERKPNWDMRKEELE